MAPKVREKLAEVAEGDELVVGLLAQFALVWLFAVQLHVLVELGRGLVAKLANLAQIIAPPKLVLGHCLLDGALLEPTRMQI